MRYYTAEAQNEAAEELITVYREAADLFPIIRKVANDFNMKVINCKIEKAIQEEQRKQEKAKDMVYSEKYANGNIAFHSYFRGQYITLAMINVKDMIDGKRLDAEKFIASAAEYRAQHLRKAADMEQAKANIDSIREQVKQLERMLSGITESLPYEIIDIYGIPRRLTNY